MENSKAAELIQIHSGDNVGVLSRSVTAGEMIQSHELEVTAANDFTLGHKFALREISQGEKVIKYGISIGSAISDIQAGEHVHLHNLKSDYLPTYTLESERNFQG